MPLSPLQESSSLSSRATPSDAGRPALRFDRVLLVHPLGYRPEAARFDVARLANITPPIGLVSLATWLARQGVEAGILDANAQPDAIESMRNRLLNEQPAFIGFSCTTSGFLDAAALAAQAKRILPGVMTVAGGVHVSALKTAALDGYPAFDFGVVGEGEQTLGDLVAGGWRRPAAVPGLVYRDNQGGVCFSGPRGETLELDALPLPEYGILSGFPDAYPLPIFNYPRTPHAVAISSRGCPYACSYCDRSVFGRSFRFNSAGYMLALMHDLHDRHRIRHVTFYDDQFTFDRDRIMAFARDLRESRLAMTFNCAARAEHLDPELLRALKAAGCWMISIGIETGDPELLARHRRRSDLDRLRECILMIKRAGIRVKGLLMMGLPGETPDSIVRSRQYVFSLPLDDFNLAKFTPFPGSPLYRDIREYGTFDEEWPRMDCMHFQFVPDGMTRDQLERLHRDFYRRHFMRPRTLWSYMTMIWRSPDSWRRFWLHAGDYARFAMTEQRKRGNG